jgi:hypothetical protein
VNVRSR